MEAARLELRAYGGDHLRGRADEGEPGAGAGAGEAGVLGEEAVAGMDRVGAGAPRRVDDGVAAQVGLRRGGSGQSHRLVGLGDEGSSCVGVGEHRDGGDAHLPAGAEDAPCDLAAVGDEQPLDVAHIRKTP